MPMFIHVYVETYDFQFSSLQIFPTLPFEYLVAMTVYLPRPSNVGLKAGEVSDLKLLGRYCWKASMYCLQLLATL